MVTLYKTRKIDEVELLLTWNRGIGSARFHAHHAPIETGSRFSWPESV